MIENLSKEELCIACKLLIRVCNNMERQIKYLMLQRLYEMNAITEEQINQELSDKPEKYLYPPYKEVTPKELQIASMLTDYLGENVEENFHEIFEFDPENVNNILNSL